MTFISREFAFFFVCFFACYWIAAHEWRKRLLLFGSYLFYGMWNWRFLFVLFFSAAFNFALGNQIYHSSKSKNKRFYLWCAIAGNLTVLIYFKYANFFLLNFQNLLHFFGFPTAISMLHLMVPVGISFYTLQAMTYPLDIYRGQLIPSTRFSDFATFVAFFPQVTSGPIERARNLLPQFSVPVKFYWSRVTGGFKLIAWGLFKKIAVADQLALLVDSVYQSPQENHGIVLMAATIFFAFQLYCDFSGYSDMAVGIARLMGFNIMRNFNYPFSASSVAEFWRRWHISFTSWVTDYLYTPIAISLRYWNQFAVLLSLFITFLLVGLWHGAQWKFVIFGALHGLALSAEVLTRNARKKLSAYLPNKICGFFGTIYTFVFFSATLIFFRAASVEQALYILTHSCSGFANVFLNLFGKNIIGQNVLSGHPLWEFASMTFLIGLLEAIQWFQRHFNVTKWFSSEPLWLRWLTYYLPLGSISLLGILLWGVVLLLGISEKSSFIYFKF